MKDLASKAYEEFGFLWMKAATDIFAEAIKSRAVRRDVVRVLAWLKQDYLRRLKDSDITTETKQYWLIKDNKELRKGKPPKGYDDDYGTAWSRRTCRNHQTGKRITGWVPDNYIMDAVEPLICGYAGVLGCWATACFRLAVAHDEVLHKRPRLLSRYPRKWREDAGSAMVGGARMGGIREKYRDMLMYDLSHLEDMAIRKTNGRDFLDYALEASKTTE